MTDRYATITPDNIVCGVSYWDGVTPWTPNDYQPINANGDPVGDPQATTAVPDTEPPTAQIGFIYNPADGSFTDPNAQPVTVSSPGLISRILSALNPFK